MTVSDLVIDDRPVRLAVRDHGGHGAPVLLLHGLGGTLLHWDELAPLLTGSHRVVAMDLRGHGLSGDGPWEWEAVLDDVRAVVDHLGLAEPSWSATPSAAWSPYSGRCATRTGPASSTSTACARPRPSRGTTPASAPATSRRCSRS
ncbi:alpha/beta fold hydrolase [Nonomuraea rubra]|uniref:alpha/beta fold hydrolase n=1 Tax=Nonomuraea rubra TaxID=46180 RepID=UPI0036215453